MKKTLAVVILCLAMVNCSVCYGQKKSVRSVSTSRVVERTVLTLTPEEQAQHERDSIANAEKIRLIQERNDAMRLAKEQEEREKKEKEEQLKAQQLEKEREQAYLAKEAQERQKAQQLNNENQSLPNTSKEVVQNEIKIEGIDLTNFDEQTKIDMCYIAYLMRTQLLDTRYRKEVETLYNLTLITQIAKTCSDKELKTLSKGRSKNVSKYRM